MAFKVVISKEYKPHSAGYRVKRVRSGSFFFGEIREYPIKVNGRPFRVYWSARLSGEENNPNKVWAFDRAIMSKLEAEGACLSHIGVMVTTDHKRKISDKSLILQMWLTTTARFKAHNVNGRLAFDQFSRIEREVSDDDKIKAMRVGRR